MLALPAASLAQTGSVGIGTNTPSDQLHTTGTVRFEKYSGTGNRVPYFDNTGRLLASGGGPVFTNNIAAPIPDNGCATNNGVTANIIVGGLPAAVASSKVAVRLNINHTVNSDLRIFLVAPGGAVLSLVGGTGVAGVNFTNTVLTDDAAAPVNSGTAPFTGLYKPSGNVVTQCLLTPTVATFGGIGSGLIVPNGTWTLKIFDAAALGTGSLISWQISFSGPATFASAEQNGFVPYFLNGSLASSGITNLPSGDVGIGTTTPTVKLDVAGGFRVSGSANLVGAVNAGAIDAASLNTSGNAVVNGTFRMVSGTPAAGELLTSNATGVATWEPPVARNTGFCATSTTTISIANGSTANVPLNYDGPLGVYFDHAAAFNTATYSYTIPAAGVYQINASVAIAYASAAAYGDLELQLFINNIVSDLGGDIKNTVPGEILPRVLKNSFTIRLNTGDVLQLRIHNGSGGIVSTGAYENTHFSGVRLY